MKIQFSGKMSTFGGPNDTGMQIGEGLALIDKENYEQFKKYFLDTPVHGATGLARRLNPEKFYIACRWDYKITPKTFLRKTLVLVKNPRNEKIAYAQPVDWGPNIETGRVADLSPGIADFLDLRTDDIVSIEIEM